VIALTVGVSQLLFLFNLAWSAFKGKPAGSNPWGAASLEWQTPDTPPKHGNWGEKLPVVHRWAYDYSVPGIEQDFVPQTVSAEELEQMRQLSAGTKADIKT
jgi:cytochrome c oxidase subunit 1